MLYDKDREKTDLEEVINRINLLSTLNSPAVANAIKEVNLIKKEIKNKNNEITTIEYELEERIIKELN